MRQTFAIVGSAVLVGLLGLPAAAQTPPVRTLRLTFHSDGNVTLTAANVTVREILAEWARQCGCYIVNWDKLAGAPLPMPVEYAQQPQAKVLESLLRQAAGFVLTPKRAGSTSVSNYETIYILATSSPVAGAYVPPAAAAIPVIPMPTMGSPEDEIPSVLTPPMPGVGPAGPPKPGQMPMVPGRPTPPPAPPRGVGTPSVFVPIVPITGTPSSPSTPIPGMPTVPQPQQPAGGVTPIPIVPVQ
jgi:hypothetical protein